MRQWDCRTPEESAENPALQGRARGTKPAQRADAPTPQCGQKRLLWPIELQSPHSGLMPPPLAPPPAGGGVMGSVARGFTASPSD